MCVNKCVYVHYVTRVFQGSSSTGLSGRTRGHTRVLAERRGAGALTGFLIRMYMWVCVCARLRTCVECTCVCETARGQIERQRVSEREGDDACPVTLGISHGC